MERKIMPLVQFGMLKDPELLNVPLLMELAANDEQCRMLTFVANTVALGQPFAAPPNIPRDRVIALRRAFDQSLRNPEFRFDAAKLAAQVEMEPTSGDAVTAIVKRTVETPAALVENLRLAMEVKGAKAGAAE